MSTKPKHLFRDRGHNTGEIAAPTRPDLFQTAMLSVLIEDCYGADCVGCGARSDSIGVWSPKREFLIREFGTADSRLKAYFYPICSKCSERYNREPGFLTGIERKLVGALREETTV
ncbi:MAG: hypothetical protein ACHRXM_02000 [Isosphaerales bacterium]